MDPAAARRQRFRCSLLIALVLSSGALPARAQEQVQVSLRLEAISAWIDDTHPLDLTVRLRNRTSTPRRGLRVEARLLTPVTSRSALRSAMNGELRGTVGSVAEDGVRLGTSTRVHLRATRAQLNGPGLGIYPLSIRVTDSDGLFVELRTALPVVEDAPDTRLDFLTVVDVVDPHPPVRVQGGYVPETIEADDFANRAARLDAVAGRRALVVVDAASLDVAADLADGALSRSDDGVLAAIDPNGPTAGNARRFLSAARAAIEDGAPAAHPYVPIDPEAFAESGGTSRIRRQFRASRDALRRAFGRGPEPILVDPDLAAAGLYPERIQDFLIPASEVAATEGAPFSPELFGTSTPLALGEDRVLVADDRLTELSRDVSDVLASAQAIVAETALRWLELPLAAEERLLVFHPGNHVSARLLAHVSDAAAGAPWLRTVLPDDLGPPQGTVTPVEDEAPIASLNLAIPAATRSLRAMRSILPEDAGTVARERLAEWETALLVAERVVPDGVGDPLLADAIRADIDAHLDRVRAAADRRITLTSRTGEIPVVLENGNDFPVQVLVHLEGRRLEFPEGRLVPIRLEPGDTTLDVPVQVLGQGTFPLEVSVLTPTRTVLGTSVVQLRSTQASRVAFVVVAGALLFLFFQAWRKGRRQSRPGQTPSVPSST